MNARLKRPTPALSWRWSHCSRPRRNCGTIQRKPYRWRTGLVADDAKKVGGQTAAQLSAQAVKEPRRGGGSRPGGHSGRPHDDRERAGQPRRGCRR